MQPFHIPLPDYALNFVCHGEVLLPTLPALTKPALLPALPALTKPALLPALPEQIHSEFKPDNGVRSHQIML